MAYDVRDSYAWRKLRDQVVDDEPACWLRLPGCTGASQTADHVIPYADRPDLALERSNHRGACHSCNQLRRNMPAEALVIGSADTVPDPGAQDRSPDTELTGAGAALWIFG